jgi:hypothetical protein
MHQAGFALTTKDSQFGATIQHTARKRADWQIEAVEQWQTQRKQRPKGLQLERLPGHWQEQGQGQGQGQQKQLRQRSGRASSSTLTTSDQQGVRRGDVPVASFLLHHKEPPPLSCKEKEKKRRISRITSQSSKLKAFCSSDNLSEHYFITCPYQIEPQLDLPELPLPIDEFQALFHLLASMPG